MGFKTQKRKKEEIKVKQETLGRLLREPL